MSLVLAIDVGTHATRAAIVDSAVGKMRLSETTPIQLKRIDQAHVEQDPIEILSATREVLRRVMARATEAELVPERAALATQRSTVLAWERQSGKALSPALSWQDTRAAAQVNPLSNYSAKIKQRSGLVLSPHYGASKLHWLLSQAENSWNPASVCLSPLVSYLLFHLLQEKPCVCDESNAGRTQLCNLHERIWDADLCELFGVPRAFLPALRPVQADYGTLESYDLPMTAVCGDQNAAFYAFISGSAEQALVNVGSGAFVLSEYTGDLQAAGELLVGLYRSDSQSVNLLIEGTVNGAGTALDWCCQHNAVSLDEFYRKLPQWLESVTEPPLFLNSIGGLGSPWWQAGPEPQFVGKANLPEQATAVVESMVFLLCANIRLMQRLQPALKQLVATGGVAQLDGFCQKLADLSGLPVLRPQETEATLLGVAALATRLQACPKLSPRTFKPKANTLLYQRFKKFNAHLRQPVLVGHRGYPAVYPENTLAGFRAALSAGAQAIECDIQFSRDGQPVVMHDADLRRTTGKKGRVVNFSAAELTAISAHEPARFGESAASEPVPRLADVVRLLCDFPNATVFVEIKEEAFADFSRDYCVQQIMAAVGSLGSRAVIISFDAAVLPLARKAGATIGWVLKHYNTKTRQKATVLAPDFLICNYRKLPAVPAELWPGAWQWFVYDVVEWPVAKSLLERGVVYIETWDIGSMLKSMQSLEAPA